MKFRLAAPTVFFVATCCLSAQETPSTPEEPGASTEASVPDSEGPSEIVTLEPDPESAAPRGDVLTLKSGQVIEGLQILRENSALYVLQITDTVTLDIPRRQVVSVEYDDYDPRTGPRKPTMIPGQRLSDQLEAVLESDISDPPFAYNNADLIQVLNDIGARVEGSLILNPSIAQTISPSARAWTVSSEPGMTLGTLLRKALFVDFPEIIMVFENDTIVLTTKSAASAEAEGQNGDAPNNESAGSAAVEPTPEEPSPPAGDAGVPPPPVSSP
ncbi:MAG: hypothetical protein KJ060_22045 [Candidatus Hydrogenedentes bacterium]|nr:hypothetical protein [Candidatus Hydrogenedentota bacterium]